MDPPVTTDSSQAGPCFAARLNPGINHDMKISLAPDERLLREGAANLQRGAETVGGRLFLTDQRLLFQSHAFNIQTGSAEVPVHEIRDTRFCWTKFLDVIPVFPNSLAVETSSGAEYRFVLSGRKAWASAIRAQARLADS